MMTYLQVKAEHALIISTLVAVWGTFVVAQGIALVTYPLYRTVYSPSRPSSRFTVDRVA